MINKRKYLKDGYKIHLPKCHVSLETKRKSCFVDQNQICTIERSLGNFERESEEIKDEKLLNEQRMQESAKVKKIVKNK